MNGLTELVFILDRSGSMFGLEADTIGGFNAMLEKQKAIASPVLISTVLFNDKSEVIHDRCNIADIPQLTEKDYEVSGCTALLDAIGDAVKHIRNVHRYIRPEDVPARTLFVITTDGMENASRRFSGDEVRKLIESQKEKGWEFLFLGANIDAVETARNFGISEDNAVDYLNDSKGLSTAYASIAHACCCFAKKGAIGREWKKAVRDDHAYRSGKKTSGKGSSWTETLRKLLEPSHMA